MMLATKPKSKKIVNLQKKSFYASRHGINENKEIDTQCDLCSLKHMRPT